MGLKFVEYDSETVMSALVTQFEKATGETLQPSDERRIFLNQLAQVIVGINASIIVFFDKSICFSNAKKEIKEIPGHNTC